MDPFITFYTPTYKRPQALAACMKSVWDQTIVEEIEHLIIPDHVGIGVGGMYELVPRYVPAVHGQYVHFLADDDILASDNVVQIVKTFATINGNPPLILVKVQKDGLEYPCGQTLWPPVCGQMDLGSYITRADIWKKLAGEGGYGNRYEGDYDFAATLARAGVEPIFLSSILFMVGDVRKGRPEAA